MAAPQIGPSPPVNIVGTYVTGPITQDCTVLAVSATYPLGVTKAGTGAGTVTSTPSGINCGTTCSGRFTYGSVVSLAQSASAGSVFTGWSGDCVGTGACAATLTADRFVTASFAQGITVVAPNGGEVWTRNSTYTISWTYLGSPGSTVKIELLKAGVVNRTITSGTSIGSGGSGSYSWKVPSAQATGTDYRIRVTSTSASSYKDASDATFRIN
jgi:hypothetical protein